MNWIFAVVSYFYGLANLIIGIGLLFALIALAHTFLLVRSGVRRHDRSPNRKYVGRLLPQQQFLRNLDIKTDPALLISPSVMDEAGKEFIMQLASRILRVAISWLQTDYYSSEWSGIAKPMRRCLRTDRYQHVQFTPGDFTRAINDNVKLIAETAPDANNLPRQ